MACLNPVILKSPETRWLAKCRKENRSYEYYIDHANQKRNLKFDPAPLLSSPYEYYSSEEFSRNMSVPCGKCDLCLKTKVNDMFVRSWFEWKRTILAKNGSTWFVTLTYGDEKLPHLDNGMPCFDKVDIQCFFKRLRKLFNSNGIYYFSYFYVTEFGGEYGRPHYHLLIHIENFKGDTSSLFKLLKWVGLSWTKIRDRRVEYSSMTYLHDPDLFDLQRVDVRLVDSSKLIAYTCKYLGKQVGAIEFDKYCDKYNVDIRYRRFHHSSVGYGDCLKDYANVDCWEKGSINIDGFNYAIPTYYRIKILREHYFTYDNGNYCYRPSDFALTLYSNLSRRQFEEMKSLAIVDKDFPRPPAWCFDPVILERIYNYIDNSLSRIPFDVPDTCPEYLAEWSNYLLEVQRYYHSQYEARAQKWKDNLVRQYGEKTGMLRKHKR